MAKQKLSPQKRLTLRKDLAAKVKAGLPRVEVLRTLAAKFGISTEGMRWYYTQATTPKAKAASPKAPALKAAKAAAPAKAAKAEKPAKAVKTASQNGPALQLPEILSRHTEGQFQRFLTAKKLVPHLEAATRRQLELRKNVQTLSRELRAQGTKARQLKREIRRLTQV